MNPLALEEGRFFHPSKDRWQTVPDRPTAWRLKPNSYIWVPSTQLFTDTKELRSRPFPREFALFITLRLHNVSITCIFIISTSLFVLLCIDSAILSRFLPIGRSLLPRTQWAQYSVCVQDDARTPIYRSRWPDPT